MGNDDFFSEDDDNPASGWSVRETLMKEEGRQKMCRGCFEVGLYNKCARCKRTHYCSVECQRADWKRHKPECKRLVQAKEKTREEIGISAEKLRNSWRKKISTLLPLMLAQCFSEEEYNQQPPSQMLVIRVKFNFNYGTYMPVGPPGKRPILITEGDTALEQLEEERSLHQSSHSSDTGKERWHLVLVSFENNDFLRLLYKIDKEIIARQCQNLELFQGLNYYDHKAICKLFCAVSLKGRHDPLAPDKKFATERNLQLQFDFLQQHQVLLDDMGVNNPWQRFVLNAYQINNGKRNLRGSHVLVCYFLFDYDSGAIKQITSYRIVTMEKAKTMVPKEKHVPYLCLNKPNCVPTLLVEEWAADLFQLTSSVGPLPPNWENWPEEKSLLVTNYFFDILKKVQFPAVPPHPSVPVIT